MQSSFMPPRRITIGDAASFVGTTPRAIRHLHESGLLPEPERAGDDRRYGYDEVVRLLWIRRMIDAGMAADDIRDACADTATADADTATAGADTAAAGADAAPAGVDGSRMGLLSDLVTSRLEDVPDGSLRQADLDDLLVTEWIFGPHGAAVHATRVIALATQPGLREESDRVDAAEQALDDTIAVDDPRVAQVAAERHAFVLALEAAIEDSGLAQGDEELFDSWTDRQPPAPEACEDTADRGPGEVHGPLSSLEAVRTMPYDFSPARLRCMELAEELAAAQEPSAP